jgi:hypothetical protein
MLESATVSVSVSFASVQHRPQEIGQVEIPQVCTVAGLGEHTPADLESVLVATPREFESRILRHTDQAVRMARPDAASHRGRLLVSILVQKPRPKQALTREYIGVSSTTTASCHTSWRAT